MHSTTRYPPQQVLNSNSDFVPAEGPISGPAYRIYDATLVAPDGSDLKPGLIPLYNMESPAYREQYWRLHRATGALLAFTRTHIDPVAYTEGEPGVVPVECLKTARFFHILESGRLENQGAGNIPHLPPALEHDDSLSDDGDGKPLSIGSRGRLWLLDDDKEPVDKPESDGNWGAYDEKLGGIGKWKVSFSVAFLIGFQRLLLQNPREL